MISNSSSEPEQYRNRTQEKVYAAVDRRQRFGEDKDSEVSFDRRYLQEVVPITEKDEEDH